MNAEQRRQWRLYILGCPGLTHAQRNALLALETFADYPQGTNARPGVQRLAEICGLKPSAVEKALAAGRDLKLIHQTARANPKRRQAAVYRLVPAPISTRTAVRVEEDFNPYETEFQPVREDVSTRTAVQPTNPLTPIHYTEREGAAGAGAPPSPLIPDDEIIEGELVDSKPLDSEPPDYCKAHMPYGTADPCKSCAVARHHKDAWKKRNPDAVFHGLLRDLADNPGINLFGTRNPDCPMCDDHGWLLDADGTPNDHGLRCNHRVTA